jgi:hypothetical protein
MKKVAIFILVITTTIGCSDDAFEFDAPNSDGVTAVTNIVTRSGEVMPNFDPIKELNGIPVNIINVGHKDVIGYLTASPTGKDVSVYTHDDGSLRQRWYIKPGYTFYPPPPQQNNHAVVLAGGNNLWNPNKDLTVAPMDPTNEDEAGAFLATSEDAGGALVTSGSLVNLPGTPYYWWTNGLVVPSSAWNPPLFFFAVKTQPTYCCYLKSYRTEYSQWEIQPVGDFQILDMKYYYLDGDKLNPVNQEITTVNLDVQVADYQYHFAIKGSYKKSANSSYTSGVSMQVSRTIKYGAPVIDLESSTTISTSQQKSWTFGQEEVTEHTVENAIDMTIPKNTPVRLVAYVSSYDLDINYVATMRRVTDGKTFRVKGRWVGLVANDLYINVYRTDTNELLESRLLDSYND